MRYYIIGTSGSGKSTLADILSKKLSIPHIELDALHFLPNWIERPDEDFIKDVEQITQAESWVVCGNYRIIKDMLMDRADVIIWLDYPFWKTFWQVSKRTFRRCLFKETCCNGNYESLYRQFFTKYSIFWWVITTYPKRKKNYTYMMQNGTYQDKWIHITNKKQLKQFLSTTSND